VNIGILGGTFDPIHIGHLVVAEEARIKVGLNEILFVPAGQPLLKPDCNITPSDQRVEMVRCAIADNPHFKLCTLEIERPGPSYTVDTLMMLRQQLGSEVSFFFILGRDTLAALPSWREPQKLVQLCRLVVAPRLGSQDLQHLETEIPGLLDKVIQLDMPVIGLSSSGIRQRIAQGLPIRYLVPDAVDKYITEQKMYLVSAG
jgi:nicotinate-nucleotide adenylyltransferase